MRNSSNHKYCSTNPSCLLHTHKLSPQAHNVLQGTTYQHIELMKVKIKDLDIMMEIKNKGIEIDVYSNDNRHLGDLVITKTKVIWCRGRTDRRNGIDFTWKKFIELMEEQG